MDQTLAQILTHLYALEEERKIVTEFLLKNEAVLRAANADVPGLPPEESKEPPAQP